MANSREYWQKRMQVLEDEQYQHSRQYYDDMQKQFEALTGVKLDDDVSWEIVVVQKDRSLSEWGARPNKAAPLLYLSSAVSLSSRCGAGDWMACRPWSPTGWWP